ncbi:hypothetical protein [Kitasatospora sp. NPDC088346]|uniref:hypothetical protein n=1 Tax=Kitasatospora sp. NPDC088346 TaxID=3364073 RepID=UPI0038034782
MLTHGELDGLPAPDEGPLALPGFWAAYLPQSATETASPLSTAPDSGCAECGGPDFGGSDLGLTKSSDFGVTEAEAGAARAALAAAGRPVARVPLEHDHTVLAVPGPDGPQLLLTHPDWARPRLLARSGPAPAGPGLSWSELLHAARHPGGQGGVTARHARLLLLLPALRATVLPSDAAVTVAAALAATGTPPERRAALAHRLTSARPGPGGDCGTTGVRGLGSPQGRLLARALGAAA